MPVELNHTIVYCRDKAVSAGFLSEILGLAPPSSFGSFAVVEVSNRVSLDFLEGDVHPQHYAFLVGDAEFDEIFARIVAKGLPYWADPGHDQPQEINTRDGGRGVYWDDPDGHILEILTVPYGGWPARASSG